MSNSDEQAKKNAARDKAKPGRTGAKTVRRAVDASKASPTKSLPTSRYRPNAS